MVHLIWLHRKLSTLRLPAIGVINMTPPNRSKLWHLSLVVAAAFVDGRRRRWMFITRSLNVTPKTTEQHLAVRSDKSVAYVTNNKRVCSTFCTIEVNYWQTRSIARPLCDSKATCMNSIKTNWACVFSASAFRAEDQRVKKHARRTVWPLTSRCWPKTRAK